MGLVFKERFQIWWSGRLGQKRILKNAFWLYSGNIGRLVAGLIVGLWLARYLGPKDWGRFNYAMAFAGLFIPLTVFGLNNLVLRSLSERPNEDGPIFGTALWMRIGATFLCFAIALSWIAINRDPSTSSLLIIASCALLSSPFDLMDVWFQAKLRSRDSVFWRNLSLVGTSLLKVGLIFAKASVAAFAVAWVLDLLLGGAGAAWALKKARGSIPMSFSWEECKILFKGCVPMLMCGVAITIYMRIDVIMLKSISGATETGIYSAASRISEIWFFLPAALVGSGAPALFELESSSELFRVRFQRLMDFLAIMGVGIAACLSLCSHLIIRILFGVRYLGAARMLSVHAWSGVFVCLGLAQGQWWNAKRFYWDYFIATSLGAILNIVLNLWLMPTMGGMGASWATLVAYAFAGTLFPLIWYRSRAAARIQLKALAFPFRLRSILREAGWIAG